MSSDKIRIRHADPSADVASPYANCHAGREAFGHSLTAIISKPEIGCTISINGQWGNGKTTFIKMWRQELDNKGYPTVLLNAWETEWAEDPLVAVLAHITEACKNASAVESAMDDVKAICGNLRNAPSRIVKLLLYALQGMTGSDTGGAIVEAQKMVDKSFSDEIDDFKSKETSMARLKNELEKFAWTVNQGDEGKPLVFIIDELDRCKPDYSVRMLEVLKHFFSVKNIIFVCAIDKKHMEDSIHGYYGSESIDAAEYLRRFFDLEVELPTPDYDAFIKHLYSYFDMDAFFRSADRQDMRSREEGEEFIRFMSDIAKRKALTLRQLERIFVFSRIYMDKQNKGFKYYPDMAVFATYLRFFDKPFYDDLKYHRMTCQEVLDRFVRDYGLLVDKKRGIYSSTNNRRGMLFLILDLICAYNSRQTHENENIFDQDKKCSLISNTLFAEEEMNEVMEHANRYVYNYSLDWLFEHLEFLNMD